MSFMFGLGEAGVPDEIKGKVTFEPHDFFATQTVEANVIYIRWTLRTWADQYVIRALQSQIPKLKEGSVILVQDTILPEPGKAPHWKEIYLRSNDLGVLACFNSKDRSVEDWKAVFLKADKRFVLKQVIEPRGSALGILEFKWEAAA